MGYTPALADSVMGLTRRCERLDSELVDARMEINRLRQEYANLRKELFIALAKLQDERRRG